MTIFVAFMLLVGISSPLQHYHIHIVNDSDGHSLEYYLCQDGLHIENVQTLVVPTGTNHTIPSGSFCLIENLTNVTIKADSQSQQAVIICQKPWRGFGFFNTSHLRLTGVTFHQCGGEIKFTSNSLAEMYTNHSNIYLGAYQKAVLLFSYCYNTILSSVSIMGPYRGFGIIMMNAFEKTNITNLHIAHNEPCNHLIENHNFSCEGSGIVFVYYANRDQNKELVDSNSVVYFGGRTRIHNNQNIYSTHQPFSNYKVCDHHQPIVIISGTALTIILAGNSYKVRFSIMDSVEVYDNVGETAILLEYCDSVNSTIIFKNLNVSNNCGIRSISGAFSVHVIHTSVRQSLSNLHIAESNFINNINIHHQSEVSTACMYVNTVLNSSANFNLLIKNANYESNKALSAGSCIYVKLDKVNHYKMIPAFGSLYIKLHNITVTGYQQMHLFRIPYQPIGNNAVFSFINVYKVEIENGTFINNQGSVIEGFGSIVQLGGNNMFVNNTAMHGGAISLYGSSYLLLYNQHSMFINNTALTLGGAIYIDSSIREGTCGFQIDGTSNISAIQLTFTNNTAGLSGNAIYVNNLYNCTMYMYMENIDIYHNIFHINPLDPFAIASFPTSLCACQAEASTTHTHLCISRSVSLHTYPGQTFQVSILAHDSIGHPAYAVVFIKLISPYTNMKLSDHREVAYPIFRNMCNTLDFTLLRFGTDSNLYASDTVTAVLQLASKNQANFNAHITILPCPIGFVISDTGVCNCSTLLTSLHDNSIRCDISTLTITLPISSWFGQLTQDGVEGFFSVCHINYCCTHCTFNAILPDAMCRYNRTGILCGKCPSNMSLTFGSDKCVSLCSNYWLFTIVGYGVVGVVLVLVLFKLRLTISTGLLGGVIFFANMTEINEHNLCLKDSVYVKPFTIFVSLLNFNLGFPLCFYSDMSMLAKIGLQFVFPVYLWLMVVLMAVISRYSTRVSNLIADQSVQVFATLVQLSFAKILSTVTVMFVSANVHSSATSSVSVWYYDGNVRYLEDTHLIMSIICIIVSVGFILPYLAFSFGASQLRRCRKSYHIRPLIDAYHGAYKDNGGYWFGMRQLALALAYGLYAGLRGSRPLLLLSLQIVSLIVLIIVQAHIRPFKNALVGLLDMWLLVLLLSLDVATFTFIAGSDPQQGSPYVIVIISLFLVTVVCVLVYHVAMMLQCSRRLLLRHRSQLESYVKFEGYKSFSGYRESLLQTN